MPSRVQVYWMITESIILYCNRIARDTCSWSLPHEYVLIIVNKEHTDNFFFFFLHTPLGTTNRKTRNITRKNKTINHLFFVGMSACVCVWSFRILLSHLFVLPWKLNKSLGSKIFVCQNAIYRLEYTIHIHSTKNCVCSRTKEREEKKIKIIGQFGKSLSCRSWCLSLLCVCISFFINSRDSWWTRSKYLRICELNFLQFLPHCWLSAAW